MKKILIPALVILLFSHTAIATEQCSPEQLKVLEDLRFVEKFLDKYNLGQCRSVEIHGRKSDTTKCVANIKIVEKSQSHDQEFPYEIIDCSVVGSKAQ